jgi:hypothetical protein
VPIDRNREPYRYWLARTSDLPIDRHLGLYRYWLSKRNGRIMPARRDIDPVEIPTLLPFLSIVKKADGEFRYRLMGTGVVQALGRDLTGKPVIFDVGNAPEIVAAMQAIGERVFASAQPVFTTGQCDDELGNHYNASMLILPLSDDGAHVNMAICAHASCFNFDITASTNWRERDNLKLGDVIDIHDAAGLERCCLDWKRVCLANGTAK